MTKSRNELIREDQLRQESQRLVKEAIEHAAGPEHRQDDKRPGYLVSESAFLNCMKDCKAFVEWKLS